MSPSPGSMPPPLEAPLPDVPKMSELGRLVGVFVSPGQAFKDIVRRPRWWVPVLISAVVVTGYLYSISQHVGWDQIVRSQMERSAAFRNLPAQQRQNTMALQLRILPYITYFAGLVGSLLNLLVVAAVLKFLADVILGAGIGFKRLMGITAYGFLPNTLMAVLATIVMYLTPPDEFDMNNPLMFNLGALVSSPPWLKALGASFDLFSLWVMVLLSIGMAAASRKMSAGKAFFMLLFPWALIVIMRVGVAALFG